MNRPPKVPVQPLIDALADHGITGPTAIGRAIGVDRLVIHRAIQAGELTVWAADRAAVTALQVHPVLIWGHQWLDQEWLNHPAVDRQARIYHEAMQLRIEARRELTR